MKKGQESPNFDGYDVTENWPRAYLIWLLNYHVIEIELGSCKADFMVYDELAANEKFCYIFL